MLERYAEFAQEHPRLSGGASVLGLGTAVLGASGFPEDVENWGKVFAAIGGEGIQWLLVILGTALLVAAAVPWLSHRRAVVPLGQGDARSSEKPQGLSPAERREHLDNLFYPPADDRRELGQECATFAMKMRVFNEEQEWRRERTIARNLKEIRDANPDIDPLQARKDAESHFYRAVEAAYALERRDEALRLFDAAREQKAIAAKPRRLVERPLGFEMGEVPHLFVALARRLDYEPVTEYPSASFTPPADLGDQLDSLMREGIDLVAELNEPVQPEKTTGGWKLEGGDAPDEWWDKAGDFSKRIRELLIERHPALLTDYRDGYNAHVKKERKDDQKANDPAEDKRSMAEKMLGLANFERSGPRRVVEACLEGLAAARHRIGASPAQNLSS